MSEILKVENLTKVFNVGKDADLYAVNNVSFTLGKGETLGLVGESGSGKTTVGRCVLRLIEPTTGKVFLNGVDITNLKDKELISISTDDPDQRSLLCEKILELENSLTKPIYLLKNTEFSTLNQSFGPHYTLTPKHMSKYNML